MSLAHVERVVVTNEVLTIGLKKYENDTTVKINTIGTVSNLNKYHVFYTCDVYKVQLDGSKNEENYQTSVILKSISDDDDYNFSFGSETAMNNEIIAYTQVLPMLIAKANKVNVDLSFIPKYIGHGKKGQYLLLENMELKKFARLNEKVIVGLNEHQAESVLKALARFHGVSMAVSPAELERKMEKIPDFFYDNDKSTLQHSQASYVNFVAEDLYPDGESKNIKIKKYLFNLADRCTLSTWKEFMLPPKVNAVLSHGDAWIANIMFKQKQVSLHDYQMLRRSSVAVDIVHFLYTSMEPHMFRRHEEVLLKSYLSELVETVKKTKNDVSLLTEKWLKAEIKKFEEYGLVKALWTAPFFYEEGIISSQKISILYTEINEIRNRVGPAARDRMKKIVEHFLERTNLL